MDNGIVLIGGAIGLWVLSKAHTGANLQFSPIGASWDGGSLQVQVDVFNPTSGSLQFQSFSAQAYVNGTPVGVVSDFTPALIAPNQHTPVNLTYTPSILGVGTAALNEAINGGGVLIKLSGSANVNGVTLPLTLTFQAIAA